ncbi:MAG: hypothetical protein R2749_14195 [Acidimicrobiales bacterium]
MGSLSVRAVVVGAVYAFVISGSAGLIQWAIDSPGWRGIFLLVVLFGFFFGGFVAGRGQHSGEAAKHGAAAGVLAFAVFQGVAAVRLVADGDSVSLVGLLFNAFTAAVCGSLGGLLATRSPGPDAVRRSGRSEPAGSD